MLQPLNPQNLDVTYYYNKKSKYFQELKQDSVGRVSVQQFLKFLNVAYCSDNEHNEPEFDFLFHSKGNWLTITKMELFCELVDIDEMTLYSVVGECKGLAGLQLNKEHEIFSYCDYFFEIPSETNMTIQSDSSVESISSIFEESFCEEDLQRTSVESSKAKQTVDTSQSEQIERKTTKKRKTTKPANLRGSLEFSNVTNRDAYEITKHDIDAGKEILVREDCQSAGFLVKPHGDQFIVKESHKMAMKSENETVCSERSLLIHVNDRVRKQSKDFHCPVKLLVAKMGYFADKNLRNAEVTIQCDLKVFEWIMDWILQSAFVNKIDGSFSENIYVISNQPLNPNNVISFLTCVSFLQIKELTDMCLCYCKSHINEILKSSKNFSHLSSNIFNRFANTFSNIEIESLKNKNNTFRSYLYRKLIISLSRLEPEPWKGHFSSLANVFRCVYCKKLVMNKVANTTSCLPNKIRMNIRGEISHVHLKDANWNLTEYIANLRRELTCWRNVYWRLWAECHFLYCTSCESYYSVYYYNKCLYHPNKPQYSETFHESGFYPCCGSKAFIYECFVRRGRGCKVRNHMPLLKNNRASTDIMRLLERFQPLIFRGSTETDGKSHFNPIEKISLNLIGNSSEESLLLHDDKEQNQWRLPYYTPDQMQKRFLLQELCHKKRKGRRTFYQDWSLQADQLLLCTGIRESSSHELCKPFSDDKHNKTHVGLMLLSENRNSHSNYDMEIDVSSSSSYESSPDDRGSNCCRKSMSSIQLHKSVESVKQSDIMARNKRLKAYTNASKESSKYAVRINQDNQRESEEQTFASINADLCNRKHRLNTGCNKTIRNTHYRSNTNIFSSCYSSSDSSGSGISVKTSSDALNSNIKSNQTRNTVIWNACSPLAGTYKRIESEWKNSKKYLSTFVKCRSLTSHCQDSMGRRSTYIKHSMRLRCNNAPNKMCIFDNRSQEVDYVCAAYKPILLRKEFRSERYHLNVDWNSIVSLEQTWNGFLQLLNERETFPTKDNKNKSNSKEETLEFVC